VNLGSGVEAGGLASPCGEDRLPSGVVQGLFFKRLLVCINRWSRWDL